MKEQGCRETSQRVEVGWSVLWASAGHQEAIGTQRYGRGGCTTTATVRAMRRNRTSRMTFTARAGSQAGERRRGRFSRKAIKPF